MLNFKEEVQKFYPNARIVNSPSIGRLKEGEIKRYAIMSGEPGQYHSITNYIDSVDAAWEEAFDYIGSKMLEKLNA